MTRGVWLALLGPDGCGKSAVLDGVARLTADSFASTRRFHLRPHMGRRRDEGPVTDPHGQRVRGAFSSGMKLGLWWLDYWTGYFLWVRPSLRRSALVLFDRYFHDLLVDPLRYRYGASLRLAEWVGRTLPRPDLTIVLDASIEVLHARKREVSAEESARQRKEYRRLAERLPDAFVVDASRPLAEVVTEVAELVGSHARESRTCHA